MINLRSQSFAPSRTKSLFRFGVWTVFSQLVVWGVAPEILNSE